MLMCLKQKKKREKNLHSSTLRLDFLSTLLLPPGPVLCAAEEGEGTGRGLHDICLSILRRPESD